MKTFIQKCLDNEANPSQIDDYVEQWHQGDGRNMELHQYLGMTKEEYSVWMFNPQAINEIIDNHQT